MERLGVPIILCSAANGELPWPRPPSFPSPTDLKLPELKLPKLDLNALFGAQTATLAAVHQAQNVLADAVQAIAKVQYGYAEQAAAEAKSALTAKELPKPEAVMASLKAAAEKGGRQGSRRPRRRRPEAGARAADPACPGQHGRAEVHRRLIQADPFSLPTAPLPPWG